MLACTSLMVSGSEVDTKHSTKPLAVDTLKISLPIGVMAPALCKQTQSRTGLEPTSQNLELRSYSVGIALER